MVSTHSRPKAAGLVRGVVRRYHFCFNTQPPEGGWDFVIIHQPIWIGFNTQPPEGGWAEGETGLSHENCFNTQPPEGGWAV